MGGEAKTSKVKTSCPWWLFLGTGRGMRCCGGHSACNEMNTVQFAAEVTAGGIHNTGLGAQRLPHPLPPLLPGPVTPSTQFEHKMQRANKGSGECFGEHLLVQMIRRIKSMKECHSQPPNHATSYTDTKSVAWTKLRSTFNPLHIVTLLRKIPL